MTMLEEKRSLLENLEIIENAISERFQRNPLLYYNNVSMYSRLVGVDVDKKIHQEQNMIYKVRKTRRSRKQMMAQEHEIKLFLKDRDTIVSKLNDLNPLRTANDVHDISEFKKLLETYQGNSSASSNQTLRDKISKYSMSLNDDTGTKKKQLISHRASELEINNIFTREEQYGGYFDLEPLYNEWLNVVKNSESTILDFFNVIEKSFIDENESNTLNISYLLNPPMDRKNERYIQFITMFSNYIENYLFKCYPLIKKSVIEAHLMRNFASGYIDKPVVSKETSQKLFCIVCGKNFANATVFHNHITGKNHKKLMNKRQGFYYCEYKLYKIINLLSHTFHDTKSFTERKLAFTLDERKEEMERISKIYDSAIYRDDEKENDISDSETNKKNDADKGDLLLTGAFNMPLGPDGMPMPYWLYKLQGLDTKYSCEICSNQNFQGRRAFEKHFRESLHEYHLKCLGITPSSAFKGITSINEAQLLWKKMNNPTKLIHGTKDKVKKNNNNNNKVSNTVKMDIEVEDEDGNVMTEQVYHDLKKQGLL